jgi:hypothetical protein
MGLFAYFERQANIRRVEAASRRQENERVVRELVALGAYAVRAPEDEEEDEENDN